MFSSRTAFDRTLNSLTARREALEADGAAFIDLTVTNPTDVRLEGPWGAVAEALHLGGAAPYAPEPLGLLATRERLAELLRYEGTAADASRLILSASTSEAYAWLFKLLCDPGDNVLIPQPSYPLFDYLARLESVEARPYRLGFSEDDLLDVQSICGDAQTRAVLVVSPSNPLGRFVSAEALHALARRCAVEGWALIVDEVFAASAFLPTRRNPVLDACLTFSLDGLSKRAALPQLKLAWTRVSGPSSDVREALARLEVIADTYLSVNGPVQHAVEPLIPLGEELTAALRGRVARNRSRLAAACGPDSTWSLLRAEAGWSAVLRIPEHPGEEATCLALLEAGVVVQPGYFFDFPSGAHLVLSLIAAPTHFDEGIQRLVRTLDSLMAR